MNNVKIEFIASYRWLVPALPWLLVTGYWFNPLQALHPYTNILIINMLIGGIQI